MIHKGLALHFRENYTEGLSFIHNFGFEFIQTWFYNGILSIDVLSMPKGAIARNMLSPVILHAVFDMPDYDRYGQKLLDIVDIFGYREVALQPIYKAGRVTENTIKLLERKVGALHRSLAPRGVKLYVENNSITDGFFNSVQDLRAIFDVHPDIGLLLDLAHVNDYDHLREIVAMRFPECVHISDRRLSVPHEHIPLGEGDLDFDLIFNEILAGYEGRVILEAIGSKRGIAKSKKVLDRLFPDS